jgi:hypothetical protein
MLAEIVLAHAIGDYVIQTSWMANEKLKRWWPAVIHGATYTVPFLFITRSPLALFVIFSTHAVIDRLRLAKYLVWAKNQVAPKRYRYPYEGDAKVHGYAPETPMFMAVWLMIIVDNLMHIIINWMAVSWL